VFADITWMCYLADEVPKEYATPFDTLVKARNTATSLVQERFKNKEAVYGFEVDDASRRIVNEAGYGKYFIHRTGHSITHELHGAGVNMDNYEAKDIRRILNGTSFSIEPGIYIDDFCGFRTELDVLIASDGTVYPGIGSEQSSLIPLLHPNIEEITKYSVK
jgi:Xaa-Pro aminopeptidase